MLDIHQISTGRGNSAVLILPDGTSVLVDAGAANDGLPETDQHPDATRTPGAWIARYIRRHIPDVSRGIDFAIITHFHPDHYGQVTSATMKSQRGDYRMSGITEVGDAIPIGTLIDRGWPTYDYPVPLLDSTMANYRRFIVAKRISGMTIERFRPGARDQIFLRRKAGRYPNLEVRNIIGNGVLWTGTGDSVRELFPPVAGLARADLPTENMCSVGIRISYGPFRYFTGGDLPGTVDPGFPAWHAPESAIAAVVGAVAVHVVNQHGSMGEESDAFLAALQSRVLIFPSWAPSHPAPDVLKRVVNSRLPPAQRLLFATDLREASRIVIGQRANAFSGPPGHIVIRVEPGGTRYWVIVTSNRDEKDTVISVSGPLDVS